MNKTTVSGTAQAIELTIVIAKLTAYLGKKYSLTEQEATHLAITLCSVPIKNFFKNGKPKDNEILEKELAKIIMPFTHDK